MTTDLTRSQRAAARWAGMSAHERTEYVAKAARGRQHAAMIRHIDRVRPNLTREQLEDLALYLAPWLRRDGA